MANLSIRKLDETVYQRLQERAATHGVSMEEEIRQILQVAVTAPERLSKTFAQHFGKKKGVVLKARKSTPHNPMDFEA